ncbi:uncharacterized protein LOC34617626 [Cyclospora cayetanensis]|uniref:Uncharacterized protein LOC34617626 n=1 Tax=Cyclospora cayetanensis TaxID=88456 RepID=A0A6P6RUG9_9EIME|nr:uncharacterized protein LOC34617626 [Cyclospora cayetanensis]
MKGRGQVESEGTTGLKWVKDKKDTRANFFLSVSGGDQTADRGRPRLVFPVEQPFSRQDAVASKGPMAICLSDAGGHHPPTESRPSAASYRRTAHVHRLMDAHRQENCADSYRWSPRLVEAENVRVPPGASDYCVSLPCKRFFTVFNVVLNLFIANAIAYVDAGSPVGFAGFKGPRDTGSRPPNLYFRQHTHPDSFQDGKRKMALADTSEYPQHNQQSQQQQQQTQQQKVTGSRPGPRSDFFGALLYIIWGLFNTLSSSTTILSCLAAVANFSFAALLLCSFWRRPLKGQARTWLSSAYNPDPSCSCCSTNSDKNVVLPIEQGTAWKVQKAAKIVGKAFARCCRGRRLRNNSHGSTLTATQEQLRREKRWLPWLVDLQEQKTTLAAAKPVTIAAPEVVAEFADSVLLCPESNCGMQEEPTTAKAAAAAAEESSWLAWPDASYGAAVCLCTTCASIPSDATAEAAALDHLLQSYEHLPPLLQWVTYFVVACVWAAEVYALAALEGPLLGAPQGPAGVSAGVLKDYHNSSGYEPGALVAHSMLMLTEMLLGVSLLAALLSEAVFIVGSKKQQERRWWIYLLVMLLCCWFAVGLCCFYCTSTTSNNAALNGSSAAQPRGTAALGTPATGTSFDGFETQQPQHQRFGSSPLLQARSGFDEGTGENREKTEESVTFGKSATAQEDVLPLSRTTPGHKQYSQLHSLQAGDWHQQEREIPFTPFSHLKSLQPITNLQSDVSNEHSYSTVKGMWKAAAPIAAKGTDMEGAPQRRLSASLWDSGTATLYLKSVNEFDNTGAEKNSRSTNTSTGAAGLLLRATAAVHKGVTGIIILCNTVLNWVGDALGALLLCSILVPPLLLRLTAFFVTLDLVRHQDALIQRRDSTQKNSVYWLLSTRIRMPQEHLHGEKSKLASAREYICEAQEGQARYHDKQRSALYFDPEASVVVDRRLFCGALKDDQATTCGQVTRTTCHPSSATALSYSVETLIIVNATKVLILASFRSLETPKNNLVGLRRADSDQFEGEAFRESHRNAKFYEY